MKLVMHGTYGWHGRTMCKSQCVLYFYLPAFVTVYHWSCLTNCKVKATPDRDKRLKQQGLGL